MNLAPGVHTPVENRQLDRGSPYQRSPTLESIHVLCFLCNLDSSALHGCPDLSAGNAQDQYRALCGKAGGVGPNQPGPPIEPRCSAAARVRPAGISRSSISGRKIPYEVSMHDLWRRPKQGPDLVLVPKFMNRLTRPFRWAGQSPRAAWRASAKKPAASARNLSARCAASPVPPGQPSGDAVNGNASAAPPPILRAKSRARASALHNSQSKRQQTGAERRAKPSAMDASVSRTTARRRSASLSFLSIACQCITATHLVCSATSAQDTCLCQGQYSAIGNE
jgi:hypothetical protein